MLTFELQKKETNINSDGPWFHTQWLNRENPSKNLVHRGTVL